MKKLTAMSCAMGRFAITEMGDGIPVDVGYAMAGDLAQLFAASPDLLATCEVVEWITPPWPADNFEAFCPWCGNFESGGHRADCSRQAAIAKARGREGWLNTVKNVGG